MGGLPNSRNPGDITRLLQAWQQGSSEAQSQLWQHVYGDLKRLARSTLRNQGRVSRAQATSLVHKAYLRLMDADVDWNDRRHFFTIAARAMRYVLADEARRQLAKKRGEGETPGLADDVPNLIDQEAHRPEEVLAVHELLERLAAIRPRHEKLVELRYFAGLSVEEAAKVLEITPRTVVRDWRAIRVWFHGELQK